MGARREKRRGSGRKWYPVSQLKHIFSWWIFNWQTGQPQLPPLLCASLLLGRSEEAVCAPAPSCSSCTEVVSAELQEALWYQHAPAEVQWRDDSVTQGQIRLQPCPASAWCSFWRYKEANKHSSFFVLCFFLLSYVNFWKLTPSTSVEILLVKQKYNLNATCHSLKTRSLA